MSDVKSRKITNKFIFIGYMLGSIFRISAALYEKDLFIITHGFIGAIIPYFLLILLYLFNVIGAADIKLISVIGLIVGVRNVLEIIVVSFVFGGIVGILEITVFRKAKDYKMPFAVPILSALVYTYVKEVIHEGAISYLR